MLDNPKGLETVPRNSLLAQLGSRTPKEPEEKQDEEEDSCPAFGFLRGVRDRGLAIEFRLRTGNREWLPYSWLGPFRYNPSVGLLLRFTGDTIILVLITGSNLDAPVRGGTMNLIDRGLQRHRITFMREMDEDELRKAGDGEPTIDRIEIVEFETQEEVREWVKRNVPAFFRD
jgi:hypothetical protein